MFRAHVKTFVYRKLRLTAGLHANAEPNNRRRCVLRLRIAYWGFDLALTHIAYCVLRLRIAYCIEALTHIAYCVLRIAYCVLRIAYCVLCSAYCVLRIAYCAPAACVMQGLWPVGNLM